MSAFSGFQGLYLWIDSSGTLTLNSETDVPTQEASWVPEKVSKSTRSGPTGVIVYCQWERGGVEVRALDEVLKSTIPLLLPCGV